MRAARGLAGGAGEGLREAKSTPLALSKSPPPAALEAKLAGEEE